MSNTFATHPQAYITSPTHAKGASLERLLALLYLAPQARWFDLSTGGGHVALGLHQRGAWVLAGDPAAPMLTAARAFLHKNGAQTVHWAQLTADNLPLASASLDGLTCRLAAHHFPNIPNFLAEANRVLKKGGVLGLVDILSPDNRKHARYCNALERLRDPSHVWAYSLEDWALFLQGAGFKLRQAERVPAPQQVGVWASRAGCDVATLARLRVLLIQAPAPIRDWYGLKASLDPSPYLDIEFNIQHGVLIAEKA